MNTNKLKKFAQETRRKLLKQVNGKLEHVLNSDSSELRGKAQTVKELRKDLDKMGRESLVDKVAYTWFNRLVALRYMDARGYQPLEMAILTPQEGQVSPQILREAMGGHIPDELKVNTQQVMDILDGRTSSSNPENEVYRLLLVASCNHLHSIFPFLFEAIDDYTELLLPDDLTSEFSIVQDVIGDMTDEDCQQVEILGWLYQFYISEKKDEVFASKGKVKKEEIPAATQLFTPRWIVEYMVQNTVGKLWVLNHPNSRLKEHMEYYIESEVTAEGVLTIDKPEELTLLDQACGSGHILVYGFELLYKIYEEEGYAPSDIPRLIIEHNLHGFEIDERAAQLAGLAILMKAREKHQRLFRKSDVPEPNITCFEDLTLSDEEIKTTLKNTGVETSDELLHDLQNMQQATNFGSLIVPLSSVQEIKRAKEVCEQAMKSADLFEKENLEKLSTSLDNLKKLATKYVCSVANPPYMGGRKMNKILAGWVKENYPIGKSDLFSCFIKRSLDYVPEKGVLGLVTMESWMFLSSFVKLRRYLLDNSTIHSLSHFGWHIMRIAFGTVSFIIQKKVPDPDFKGTYSYLEIDDIDKRNDRPRNFPVSNNGRYNHLSQKVFRKIPGNPFCYWLSKNAIMNFEKPMVAGYAHSFQGMISGNNDKLLKFWQELSHEDLTKSFESFEDAEGVKTWVPYQKGGSFKKWYGNYDYFLKWNGTGDNLTRARTENREYYFKPCISWTFLSSTKFAAREVFGGSLWDVAGSSLFPNEKKYKNGILGLLCSSVGVFYLKAVNPTLNYQVENILALPISNKIFSNEIDITVDKMVQGSKQDWDSREHSWDFQQNELIRFNKEGGIETLEDAYEHYRQYWTNKFFQLHQNEEELNRQFIEIYGLQDELTSEVPLDEITILQEELDSKKLKMLEKVFRGQKTGDRRPAEVERGHLPQMPFKDKEVMAQFLSYAVGCMFGRYSLDKEGLILANQGETLEDYLQKISLSENEVTFLPDDDNIIPVLDDEWFEDDIVARFYEFLKASFGEAHFQKNLQFVEEMLGHDVRKYFDKQFYKDHYKRYNKRPIYWKFSSPKDSFSVLIYMHRYTPDTLNNILNNYLREFIEKLKTQKEQMQHLENTGSASEKARASKEIDKLNAMIKDCEEYEREMLYPLASERIEIDLDDGVLVNYNLFGKAVEEIKSVNDPKKKKKVKEFDWIDGGRVR